MDISTGHMILVRHSDFCEWCQTAAGFPQGKVLLLHHGDVLLAWSLMWFLSFTTKGGY